jgi:hypothetical protein
MSCAEIWVQSDTSDYIEDCVHVARERCMKLFLIEQTSAVPARMIDDSMQQKEQEA